MTENPKAFHLFILIFRSTPNINNSLCVYSHLITSFDCHLVTLWGGKMSCSKYESPNK